MNELEFGNEPSASRLVRPLIIAFVVALVVMAGLATLSIAQIDSLSTGRETTVAAALIADHMPDTPEHLAKILSEAGFAEPHAVLMGDARPDEQLVPVLSSAGLRSGFIAFTPLRPGMTTILATLPINLPIFLLVALFLSLILVRLDRHTRELAHRRDAVHQMALTDPLSGLPNRREFQNQLTKLIGDLTSTNGQAALYFVDLDSFKSVNDTHGHAAGDALIRSVSDRLKSFISPSDLAARLSGDEFAIVRRNVGTTQEALAYGRSVVKLLSLPYELDGQAVKASASVGVAIATPGDVPDFADFCRAADLALYQAKESGRNRAMLFSRRLSKPDADDEIQVA